MDAFAIICKIFTIAFLFLAFIGYCSPATPTGKCLPLLSHPLILRLRFFAFGLLFALYSQHYPWRHPGGMGLLTATLLLIGAIRNSRSHRSIS